MVVVAKLMVVFVRRWERFTTETRRKNQVVLALAPRLVDFGIFAPFASVARDSLCGSRPKVLAQFGLWTTKNFQNRWLSKVHEKGSRYDRNGCNGRYGKPMKTFFAGIRTIRITLTNPTTHIPCV